MDTLQHKVLDFEPPADDFDPNFIPEDGIQYLQQVAYERNKCPVIVVKPLNPSATSSLAHPDPIAWHKFKAVSFGSACVFSIMLTNDFLQTDPISSTLRPTAEWKSIQIKEFAALRARIAALRPKFIPNPSGGEQQTLPELDEQSAWLTFCRTEQPLLSIMLRIDQRSLEVLFEHQLEWLEDAEQSAVTGVVAWYSSVHWISKWIYAGLGCLHLPLEPNMHHLLRQVARTCIKCREHLEADQIEIAAPLNLLICIITSNFDQADLADGD